MKALGLDLLPGFPQSVGKPHNLSFTQCLCVCDSYETDDAQWGYSCAGSTITRARTRTHRITYGKGEPELVCRRWRWSLDGLALKLLRRLPEEGGEGGKKERNNKKEGRKNQVEPKFSPTETEKLFHKLQHLDTSAKLIWKPQRSFPLKVSNYSSLHSLPSSLSLHPYANHICHSSSSSPQLTSSSFPSFSLLFSLYRSSSAPSLLCLPISLTLFLCLCVVLHFSSITSLHYFFSSFYIFFTRSLGVTVSRAVKGACTPDPHRYAHAQAHTEHTHIPLCCTCQDPQQYKLRLRLNTKDFWDDFTFSFSFQK